MAPDRHDKICVLLVDDDPDTRAMYAVALSLSDVEVLESGDGATALSPSRRSSCRTSSSPIYPAPTSMDLSSWSGFKRTRRQPEFGPSCSPAALMRKRPYVLRPCVLNSWSSLVCPVLSRPTSSVR